MASSTSKSGKNRFLKKGSRVKNATSDKTSHPGSFWLPNPTLLVSRTGEKHYLLSLSGCLDGITLASLGLDLSTLNLSTKCPIKVLLKRALDGCADSPTPEDKRTKSSRFPDNPHFQISLYKELYSHLHGSYLCVSEQEQGFFSRSTTQLCVILKELEDRWIKDRKQKGLSGRY